MYKINWINYIKATNPPRASCRAKIKNRPCASRRAFENVLFDSAMYLCLRENEIFSVNIDTGHSLLRLNMYSSRSVLINPWFFFFLFVSTTQNYILLLFHTSLILSLFFFFELCSLRRWFRAATR